MRQLLEGDYPQQSHSPWPAVLSRPYNASLSGYHLFAYSDSLHQTLQSHRVGIEAPYTGVTIHLALSVVIDLCTKVLPSRLVIDYRSQRNPHFRSQSEFCCMCPYRLGNFPLPIPPHLSSLCTASGLYWHTFGELHNSPTDIFAWSWKKKNRYSAYARHILRSSYPP